MAPADVAVVRACGAVGMRSRASGVARLEAVAAPLSLMHAFLCILFMFYGRATPDARERILPRHARGPNAGCREPLTTLLYFFVFRW